VSVQTLLAMLPAGPSKKLVRGSDGSFCGLPRWAGLYRSRGRGNHPLAEALALAILSLVACVVGDREGAVQLARQAEQIAADRHAPTTRVCGHALTTVLIAVDELGLVWTGLVWTGLV
jgi:hypothetical protein